MTLEQTLQGWTAFLRFGKGRRKRFPMAVDPKDEPKAQARYEELKRLAADLGSSDIDAEATLRAVAAQASDRAFAIALRAARDELRAPAPEPEGPRTFQEVSNFWTTGKLHEQFPKRVRKKKDSSARKDRDRLRLINAVVGSVPVREFTVEHAEQALKSLPPMNDNTYLQYQLVIHQVLRFAGPGFLKLIEHSPLPEGWMVQRVKPPVFGFLYAEEDAQLLGCELVPYERRLVYGVLDREGLRISEALRLTWSDVDLARGILTLDENKTNTPRAWAMRPDVVEELRFWKNHSAGGPVDRLFPNFEYEGGSAQFRADLWTAGVRRKELHEKTAARGRIRLHDQRATFATHAFAEGKNESWIMDRTGHTTSGQLHAYRRQARTIAHLEALRRSLAPLPGTIARPRASGYGGPVPEGVVAWVVGNGADRWKMPSFEGSVVSSPDSATRTPEPNLAAAVSEPPTTGSANTPTTPGVVVSDQGVVGETAPAAAPTTAPETAEDAALRALAFAIEEATKVQRWDVVLACTAELARRQLARTAPSVPSLDAARKRRDEGGK